MKAEEPQTEKSTAHWMLLPFRFALKIIVAAAFLGYIFIGMDSTINLYKRNLLRAQDINNLYVVIDDAVQKGDPQAVTAWLQARPLGETDQLVKMITPKSPELNYSTFFEIFRREQKLGRTEEALFWLQLGRYRLSYDTERCGAEPAGMKAFEPLLDLAKSPETDALLQAHPELLKKTVQRVLDFDAKYPAHNDPAPLCKTLSQELPVDEVNWEGYHQHLRKHTAEFLKSLDKAKQK